MTHPLIETLAAARKAQHITQAQLAEQAGLSRMAVQRTETGDVDPRYSTVSEMARVLNMALVAVPADLLPAVLAVMRSGEQPAPPVQASAAAAQAGGKR